MIWKKGMNNDDENEYLYIWKIKFIYLYSRCIESNVFN